MGISASLPRSERASRVSRALQGSPTRSPSSAEDTRPLPGWAVDQLRILGDVRDRAPTGKALTPMERRIAELAASGLTNRAIATELRIPAGTVGGQLSRVYRNLGVNSRAALRNALRHTATNDLS